MKRLLAIAIAALLLAGCSKTDDEPASDDTPRPEMSEAELDRGLEACGDYVSRICALAEEREDLAERCHTARSKPKTVRMLIDAARADDADPADAARLLDTARSNINACLQSLNDLERGYVPTP